MIAFSLRCRPGGHGFEAWFRSSADWERQQGLGLVGCPVCGAEEVEKALMAPAVRTARRAEGRAAAEVQAPETAPAAAPSAEPAPVTAGVPAGVPPELVEAFGKLQDMSREARKRADYVGERFAEEARRIHFGETPARGIYGEASRDEVEALREDGIVALPLPPLPEDRN